MLFFFLFFLQLQSPNIFYEVKSTNFPSFIIALKISLVKLAFLESNSNIFLGRRWDRNILIS